MAGGGLSEIDVEEDERGEDVVGVVAEAEEEEEEEGREDVKGDGEGDVKRGVGISEIE
jgi:hypothetical protein